MNDISGDDCYGVLNNNCLVFFYFTASWCGPCKKLSPLLSEFASKMDSKKILFYKIDISNDDNSELCEKCNVESVPTCIIFKDRKSMGIVNGLNIEGINDLLNRNL
jgi:thioredoxin 1